MDPNRNPFIDKPLTARHHRSSFIITVLEAIAGLLIVSLVLYLFILTPNQVDGSSMSPTLEDDEVILINRLPQIITSRELRRQLNVEYKRGDIVVAKVPTEPKEIVKRVIAVAQDRIRIGGGKVYVNGQELYEYYLPYQTTTPAGDFLTEGQVYEVPTDHLILLGDNRDQSEDSRSIIIGAVKREYIIGKAFLRVWPGERFTTL